MSKTASKPLPLSSSEVQEHLQTLNGWQLSQDGKAIRRECKFPDFAQALDYVNRLGEAAEAANHHPDLTLGWGYVGITFTTHDADGLRKNDFLMAQKAEALLK